MNQNQLLTKLMTLTDYEFVLCKRKNGTEFIKICTYNHDVQGFIEVARINSVKNQLTATYGDHKIDEIHWHLNQFDRLAKAALDLARNKQLILQPQSESKEE